jgi:hypothetical protein
MKIAQILLALICITAARKVQHGYVYEQLGRTDNTDDASYSNIN